MPIIDKLEAERLVERHTSASNRRYKSVWLTSKGRRVLTDLTSRARVHEERLGKGLSAEERDTLLRLLGAVLENLGPE